MPCYDMPYLSILDMSIIIPRLKKYTRLLIVNFGKCRPIFKILSLPDSLCKHYKAFQPHLSCVATLPCEIQKLKQQLNFTFTVKIKSVDICRRYDQKSSVLLFLRTQRVQTGIQTYRFIL